MAASFMIWSHMRMAARPKVPVKRIVRPAAMEKRPALPLPAIIKKFDNPKVAIVMDDFGYNTNNLSRLFSINKPVTLSILPNLPYSTAIAEEACARRYEVTLHLPLESHRKEVREEMDTIRSIMAPDEVAAKLDRAIYSVSGLRGVSNHMGSKATEDKRLMEIIFGELKKKGLYFLDSLTSQRSVCQAVAKAMQVPYARRDIFLDNSNDVDYIRKQVLSMRRLAFKKGRTIAICHDRAKTVKVLSEMMPELSRDGIRFIFLSEMVTDVPKRNGYILSDRGCASIISGNVSK